MALVHLKAKCRR